MYSICINKMVRSHAQSFIGEVDPAFFIRHVVSMNFAGKVYSVLRGVEIAANSTTGTVNRILFIVYAVCMCLGMYWYTRFWSLESDVDSFYNGSDEHCLSKNSKLIIVGAAAFYMLFGILFAISYGLTNEPASLAFSFWSLFCFLNIVPAYG